jgi:hypothetical protein
MRGFEANGSTRVISPKDYNNYIFNNELAHFLMDNGIIEKYYWPGPEGSDVFP